MRKMLIGLGTVVAGVALVPFVMGFIVERDIHNLIQHANSSHDVAITLKDYHRGWFKSTARIEARVKNLDGRLGEGELLVLADETIRHGPIFKDGSGLGVGRALIESKIVLPNDVDAALNLFFGGGDNQPRLIHRTKITLLRDIISKISIPKFTISKPGQGTLTWLGFDGDMNMSSNYKSTNGQFKLSGLTIDSPMLTASIGAIQMNYDAQNQNEANGKAHFAYQQPSVNIILFGQPLFAMDNFELNTVTSLEENILSQTLTSKVGKSAVTNVVFGPGQLQLELNNINAEPLTQLADMMQQLQNNKTMSEAEREATLNKTLSSALPKVLANKPALNIKNFEMQMPAGQVQAKGTFSLKPMSPGVEPTVYLRAPENWIIDANLLIPVTVMEETLYKNMYSSLKQEQDTQAMVAKQQGTVYTPVTDDVMAEQAKSGVKAQLQLWEEKGYLKKSDTRYQIVVSMKEGKLMVNDIEVAYH